MVSQWEVELTFGHLVPKLNHVLHLLLLDLFSSNEQAPPRLMLGKRGPNTDHFRASSSPDPLFPASHFPRPLKPVMLPWASNPVARSCSYLRPLLFVNIILSSVVSTSFSGFDDLFGRQFALWTPWLIHILLNCCL